MNEDGTISITLRIAAALACFRRPEFAENFVSYDLMPPTVARGILARLLAVKDLKWQIDRIGLCSPIRHDVIDLATDRGLQRAYVLREPTYLVDVCLNVPPNKQGMPSKEHLRNALDRVDERVHLGVPQSPANVSLAEVEAWNADLVSTGEIDLGWMLYDLNGPRAARAQFFRAYLRDGILSLKDVPRSSLFR